jgi:hypothetical protein
MVGLDEQCLSDFASSESSGWTVGDDDDDLLLLLMD